MSRPPAITPADIAEARRWRKHGASWKRTAEKVGHDASSLRCHLDPAYRRLRLRQGAEARQRERDEAPGKRGQVKSHRWYADLPELIAERDTRYAEPPSLDNVLTGTPPHWRSALSGWQQRGVAELVRNGRPPNDARPKPWRPLCKGEAKEAAE